ncbi:glycosyltransferase [Vibrio spartinae]|uniref:Glycosyltransferase KanE n=1 Tax=Vibrio spartinae TaxID=1918945 RepID=A0ABX6QUX8_9VIBR|nr:glycosyltransferase [Vibrio spartinae]QMV12969.1 Glycosyltransferase KanE [Vibrio spartinae]
MSHIKVLHVYRTFFPDPPGGLQEAIRQICINTRPYSVISKVFTLSPDPNPESILFDDIEVIRAKSYMAPASCDISGIDGIRKFKELSDWADIINYHFPWPFGDFLNCFAPKNKIKVITYHSDIVRQKYILHLYQPLMSKMLREMDKVIVTSDNYARTSKTIINYVNEEQLSVIPLGIKDLSIGYNSSLKNSTLEKFGLYNTEYVLYLGVLRYYKGLDVVIDAAKKTDKIIVIAGSGPEEERLKTKARGIKNIIFTGRVTEQQKLDLIANCKLMVLASHLRSEAFGMVLVEGLMFAKPLISCEIGTGTSYVNVDGLTGEVILPNDCQALATAIDKISNDKDLYNKYSSNARARYMDIFSDVSLGKLYSNLYLDILEDK